MKKLALTILAVAGITGVSFAQGYVQWNSSPGQFVVGVTNSTVYSSLSTTLGGGQSTGTGATGYTSSSASSLFYYTLLASTTDTSASTTLTDLANNWTSTGLVMTNGTFANGRINPVSPTLAATVSYTTTTEFELVAWSANLGTSYATVLNELKNWTTVGSTIQGTAFFGVSSASAILPSSSSAVGTSLFGTTAIYNPSTSPLELYALAVPEPGTMALAALGGASLLLFRRKK
jgi:hypothetical protein